MFINDFLEKYGNIQNYKNNLLNPYSLPLNQTIYNKEEFNSLKLQPLESKPESGTGDLMNHQKIVSRFLSSHTLYDRLLLVHEPGTGKSCSAIGTAELIRAENSTINGAIFLVKGEALADNLIKELIHTCTDGRYLPENYDNLTDLQKTHRVNKIISSFYTFKTFEKFSNEINGMSDKTIIQEYSNKLIVVDEAHNLRIQTTEKDSKKIYNSFHRFLHLVENCKVMLMSGTPMKDQPEEIASIMNLILPEDKQLPLGNDFITEYLEERDGMYYIREDKEKKLKGYLKGRVSYLRSMSDENIVKNFVGEFVEDDEIKMKYFKLDVDIMSQFQGENYKRAYRKDSEEDTGVFNESRQSSLFVYPDGSYGNKGFKKYIEEKTIIKKLGNKEVKYSEYYLIKELANELSGKTNEEKLQKLKKFSSKYYRLISELLEAKDKSCFVYCEFVEGSGLILLSLLLELFGFSNAKGTETTERPRYALLTTKTTTPGRLKNILNKFNSFENRFGGLIKVVLGSKVIGEGFSLKNIQEVHILTPHWNYSETDQAIARGFRLFSHTDIQKEGEKVIVNVYQHCSLNREGVVSIDLKMYKTSENKDIAIHQIERLIKEAAFDCELNYDRNLKTIDGSRDCDYQECKYTCDGVDEKDYSQDLLTYNLFYSDEVVNKTISDLKKLYNRRFFYSFEELKNIFSDTTDFQLLSSLSKCINEKVVFINPYGFNSYLSESNNQYYLNNNISFFSNFTDEFYTEKPILVKDTFIDDINDIFYSSIPDKIEEMNKEQNEEKRKKILQKIPNDIQELLIELSLIAKGKDIKEKEGFTSWIINFFSPFIVETDSHIISSFLYKTTGKLRCLDLNNLEWSDCTPALIEEYKKKLEKSEEKLESNKYGYYGIIEKTTNKFQIRDVSTGEKIEIEDERKKTKGKVCTFYNREDLLKVINSIKLEVLDKDFCKLSKKELLKLSEERKYKNAKKAYSDDELSKMKIEDLCRIVYWAGQKKEITCEKIQKWFEEKKLIRYV